MQIIFQLLFGCQAQACAADDSDCNLAALTHRYVQMDEEDAEKELGVDMAADVVTCEVPFGGVLFLNNVIPHRCAWPHWAHHAFPKPYTCSYDHLRLWRMWQGTVLRRESLAASLHLLLDLQAVRQTLLF